MLQTLESQANRTTDDASLIARIASLRESVRGQKQKALAMWNACQPAQPEPRERVTHGKFTEKLAQV